MILPTALALAFIFRTANSQPPSPIKSEAETESTSYMQQTIDAWKENNTTKSVFLTCNSTDITNSFPLCTASSVFMNKILSLCSDSNEHNLLLFCITTYTDQYLGIDLSWEA